VKWVPGLSRR